MRSEQYVYCIFACMRVFSYFLYVFLSLCLQVTCWSMIIDCSISWLCLSVVWKCVYDFRMMFICYISLDYSNLFPTAIVSLINLIVSL